MATPNIPLTPRFSANLPINTLEPIDTTIWSQTNTEFTINPYSGYTFYEYPKNVDANERHGYNFCVFYISVPGASTVGKGGFANNPSILTPQGTTTRSQAGTTGTKIGGTGKTFGNLGSVSRRTKTAIKTYMPNVIELNHNVKYENASLGGLGALASIDSGATITDLLAGLAVETAKSITARSGKIATAAGAPNLGAFLDASKTSISGVGQALSGLSINPHYETLFQGVDFRRFNFIFDFFPKNEDEQLQVREIINLFRFHMHPELLDPNGANRVFITPSEFEVLFYHGNQNQGVIENTYLFAISSCALVDIKVDYTATGMWSAHYQGAPVGMRVTLTFQELEIMTKNRLAELEFERFNSITSTTFGF